MRAFQSDFNLVVKTYFCNARFATPPPLFSFRMFFDGPPENYYAYTWPLLIFFTYKEKTFLIK